MSSGSVPGQEPADPLLALLRANVGVVMGMCLAYADNVHDAEDLAQETLLKAVQSIRVLRDPASIRPWLLQIAKRLCINHGMRPKSMDRLPREVPASVQPPNQRLERLHAALAELPEQYREAISIYYLDGRNGAAVAQSLGISPSAARVRLHRGRLLLHSLLKETQP